MSKSLTKEELETIIIFNEKDDTAKVETPNKKLKNKLEALHKAHPDKVKLESSDDYGFINCVLPKKWVKIAAPRVMSEEQRAIAAERLKALRK